MPVKRFSEETIAEVRQKADLLAIVSESVQMKAAGSVHKGLCPFHDEKTASFQVNPATNIWHCFGCGKHGDVIDFIMETEGVDFRMAVTHLADIYGIDAEGVDVGAEVAQQGSKSRIIEANIAASEFFSDLLLTSPEAQAGRELLEKRGFDVAAAVSKYGCGYAPTKGAVLFGHLRGKGFSTDEIVSASLARESKRPGGQPYDFFRGRLLWTIRNPFGKAIGFGARRLSERDPIESKFINTAETPVYKKSNVLYGFDLARRSMSQTKQAVVVEGYTDVMACHEAGITNAVASCGTAFGGDHLNILRRIIGEDGEVVSGFDDDNAGRKAAMAFYVTAREDVKRLTVLPAADGMDPDEYRQAHGNEALHGLLDHRIPLVMFVIRSTIQSHPLVTPEDRSVALDSVLPLLTQVKDTMIRAEYADTVGKMLGYSPRDILARADRSEKGNRGGVRQGDEVHLPMPDDGTTPSWPEQELLRLMVQNHEAAEGFLDESRWHFDLPASEGVAAAIERALDTPHGGKLWSTHVIDCCTEDGIKGLVGVLAVEALPVPVEKALDYAQELLDRISTEGVADEIGSLRTELASTADPDRRREILSKIIEKTRAVGGVA